MRFGRRKDNAEDRVRCSFCGKRAADVARVIAGPGVCICDECVALCNRILEQDSADTTKG